LLGIAGVVLLLGVDLEGAALIGGLLVLLASLGYAIGGLLVKRRLHGVEPMGVAASVMVISAVATAVPAVATAPAEMPDLGSIAAVTALGVVGTGVAFAIFYGLIARIGPSKSFVVTYLVPGFAVIYGAVLLDESITVATMGGLALILGGSYLAAEGRLPGRPPPGGGPAVELPDDHPVAGGLSPAGR
ncbi:MAG TPA: DMT family transporter, partial [Solirubrobacterales bacterium]|nr:DMT family transporter [Solirubrobacterales bacterium]